VTSTTPRDLGGSEPGVPAMGWGGTLALFVAAGTVLLLGTRLLIPAVGDALGVERIIAWFLVAGGVVFLPLLAVGYLLLRQESRPGQRGGWGGRLRFRRMDRGDWFWTLGAVALILGLTAAIQLGLQAWHGDVDLHPPFMAFDPLSPGRYWILAAWLPFWVVNIMSEEVVWRGVLLPRQEAALGRHAWFANAVGWTVFHVAFGWQLLAVLLPILFVLPYVVQRRGNSWIGVIVHAGINGPAFVAISLGLA